MLLGGRSGCIRCNLSPALQTFWKRAQILAGVTDSGKPEWAVSSMVIVVHALSRRMDPVSTDGVISY